MKWTKKDTTKLNRLWKQGLKIKEIAENFPIRSPTSVAAKINEQQQRGNLHYRNKMKSTKIRLTIKDNKKIPKEISDYSKKLFKQYDNHPSFLKSMGKKSRFVGDGGWRTPTANRICIVLDECETLLLAKNKAYGDSALEPIRIFSKADGQEQLKVRIDDKLNRLIQGDNTIESDRDVIMDLVGYLVLLLIAMDETKQ